MPRRIRLDDLRPGASLALSRINTFDVLGTIMVINNITRKDATSSLGRMRKRVVPLDESNFVNASILVDQKTVTAKTVDANHMKPLVDSMLHDKSPTAISRPAFLKIIDDFRNGDMSRVYDVAHGPYATTVANGASGGGAPAAASANNGASGGATSDDSSSGAAPAAAFDDAVPAAGAFHNGAFDDAAPAAAAFDNGAFAPAVDNAAPVAAVDVELIEKAAIDAVRRFNAETKAAFDMEQLREEAKAKRAREDKLAAEEDEEAREIRRETQKKKKITDARASLKAVSDAYINTSDETAAILMEPDLQMLMGDVYKATGDTPPKRITIKKYTTLRKKKQQKSASAAAEVARNTAVPATVIPASGAAEDEDDGVFVMTNQDSSKYYVGKAAAHKVATIAAHVSGHSAIDGCRVHVQRLLSTREVGKDRWEAETLAQMVVHGITNVKGDPRRATKENAYQRLCEVYGLCFKCGGDGHWMHVCDKPAFCNWTTGLRRCGKCGSRDHFAGSCRD